MCTGMCIGVQLQHWHHQLTFLRYYFFCNRKTMANLFNFHFTFSILSFLLSLIFSSYIEAYHVRCRSVRDKLIILMRVACKTYYFKRLSRLHFGHPCDDVRVWFPPAVWIETHCWSKHRWTVWCDQHIHTDKRTLKYRCGEHYRGDGNHDGKGLVYKTSRRRMK